MNSNAGNSPRAVLGIDPGRSKCGIAVVRNGPHPETLAVTVVPTEGLLVEIAATLRRFAEIEILVIGDGTQSRVLRRAVASMFPNMPIAVVDEHGSSRRARIKYMTENPPVGWRRLIPAGLRTPDRPYDDIVADLLARDFLSRLGKYLQQSP